MQPQEVAGATNLQEFKLDGRADIAELYRQFLVLAQAGWDVDVAYEQSTTIAGQAVTLPTLAVRTKTAGPALWLIGGIHGEEPAGVNAIMRSVSVIQALGGKFPVVLLPLCNPEGYRKGWRYPDEARDWKAGHSVSDAEHMLPSIQMPDKARRPEPGSENAAMFTNYILALTKAYPPHLVVDLHEDENPGSSYIRSLGLLGSSDPVAREIVTLFSGSGVQMEAQGTTRFGEVITDGIVSNIHDGSIDELLASPTVIVNSQAVPGPAAKSVIVVETPASRLPLPARVDIQAKVIASLEKLWGLVPR